MVQLHQFENADLRDQLRAALIHQARQPLFALQNYLAATVHVADRLPVTPDIELMRKCLAQMQTSIEKLSGTITKIAEFNTEDKNACAEISLLDFLHETFQISCFVARQFGLRIQWDIAPGTTGTVEIHPRNTQLALIQWILATCSSDLFRNTSETPVRIVAEPASDSIRFRAIKDAAQAEISLQELNTQWHFGTKDLSADELDALAS